MTENTVTTEQLVGLLRRKGGAQTLSVLSKNQNFVDAINSVVGKELLRDAIAIHEVLLMKVANLEATPEETMEYRAILKIIRKWSERIATHEKALKELVNSKTT